MSEKKKTPTKSASRIVLDFSDIPENIPDEGSHEAVIEQVEMRYGKNSGAPYLNWQFRILDGDYANFKVWMMTSLSPAALFRVKAVAEALGFEGGMELEVDEDSNMVIYPPFEGTAVTIEIEHQSYQGRDQARVKDILDYHTTHHLEGVFDDDDEWADVDDDDDVDDDELVEEYLDDLAEDIDDDDEEEEEEEEEVAPVVPKRRRKKS